MSEQHEQKVRAGEATAERVLRPSGPRAQLRRTVANLPYEEQVQMLCPEPGSAEIATELASMTVQKASASDRDKRSPVTFEAYLRDLRAQMQAPHVEDPKLKKLVSDLYRPGAKVGSGSTAAAVRYERETGQKVGGVEHSQKAKDYIRSLQKWLKKNKKARPGDRAAAENIIKDLQSALSGR